MHPVKSFTLLSILVALSYFSCRPDILMPGDPLNYIPDNVTSVTAFNLGQLVEKADFHEIKGLDFYRDFLEGVRSENAAFARILEDPGRAGVDLSQNAYLSIEVDASDKEGFAAILFPIEDNEAFEQTLKDAGFEQEPAATDPGHSKHHGTTLLWREGIGILGSGHLEEVHARTAAYFTTREDRSVGRNKNLRKALSQDFDVLNWVTSAGFADLFQLDELRKMARFSEKDLKENYLQSFLHFEDGEIKAETKFYFQKKLSNDLALVLKHNVETDFSAKLPGERLLFYTNFGIRPKGINQLLIEYHIKGMSVEPLKKLKINFEDLINAFNGDAAFAIYKGDGRFLDHPDYLWALQVDSREHLDRILAAAQEAGRLRSVGEDRYQIISKVGSDPTDAIPERVEAELLIRNGILYLSDRPERLDQVQSGYFNTGGRLQRSVAELAAGRAFAAFLDMGQFNENLSIQNIEVTAGLKGGATTLKMTDESENSLKQLFLWLEDAYRKRQPQ